MCSQYGQSVQRCAFTHALPDEQAMKRLKGRRVVVTGAEPRIIDGEETLDLHRERLAARQRKLLLHSMRPAVPAVHRERQIAVLVGAGQVAVWIRPEPRRAVEPRVTSRPSGT